MKHARIFAGLMASTMLLAACSGGGSTPPTRQGRTAPSYTGPQALADFSWGKSYIADAQYVAPVSSGSLGMQVQISMRNSQGLLSYAKAVSDPKSALYRHFLTPEQIANQFGASASDYAKAAAYFQSYGLHVGGWKQREQLFVSGPIGGFESAFGTKFASYIKDGHKFVAPSGTPHFASELPVDGVVGLVHAHTMHPYFMRASNANFQGYSPQQVQRAFDYSGAYTKYDGSGISVAIVGTGPIVDADLQKLHQVFGVRTATVTQPPVTDEGVSAALAGQPLPSPTPGTAPPPGYFNSSGLQSPPPATSPDSAGCRQNPYDLTVCNPEDGEAQLDTQTVATLAPGSNVLFYLGYNPNDCAFTDAANGNQPCAPGAGYQEEGIGVMDAEIQQIIADNTADVVSVSIGGGEPFNEGIYFDQNGIGFGPIEYATLVSEGIGVFVSSGDTGAYECTRFAELIGYTPLIGQPCSSYPASDPSVVSVGGVTAPLDDAGRITTQITAWGDQTTWGGSGSFQNDVGSGGGVSSYFAAPDFQAGGAAASVVNGHRGQPDISLLADPHTGPAMVMDAAFPDAWGNDGGVFATGGTSLAAPQMAAMWALVLQACKQDAGCSSHGTGQHSYRLGNPNKLLYAIFANASQYASSMYDVTYGDNSAMPPSPGPSSTPMPGFRAAAGYDLVTGIGVPFAGHLIDAVIANQNGTNPNLP